MKRILVTGGAGFLGQHLCRRLLDEGHHVTCWDNLSTGRRRNIADFADGSFLFRNFDVRNSFSRNDFDEIYNLACPASPKQYQADPVGTTMTSVLGALNALECARLGGARILQASTSEIYGDPLEHPQAETYRGNVDCTGARACYDEGKRCAESLFFDYHRKHGVDIRIARIFNTYGPGMAVGDGRMVSNFIVQGLKGQPITLHGDGTQTRSLCYVSDTVEGLIRLMASNCTEPVNIGSEDERSVREIAKKIWDLAYLDGKWCQFTGRPVQDPERRRPDIGKARRLLDWAPVVPLETGLARTVEYFRRELETAA